MLGPWSASTMFLVRSAINGARFSTGGIFAGAIDGGSDVAVLVNPNDVELPCKIN